MANPTVDHGRIATLAVAGYDRDPVCMRRGDTVISRSRALMQQELRAHPRVYEPSEALSNAALRAIADAVWPPG